MQYLKQVVTAINQSIQSKLTDVRFAGSEYNGIAISAVDSNAAGGPRLMPLIADHYDNERWVGIDDTFPLRIYHKNNGIVRVDEAVKSYGDGGYLSKKETAQFAIIAYGNRMRLKMTPEELEAAIAAGLPSQISDATCKELKLSSCLIKPTTSIFDPVLTYLAEYRTDKYELGPNALLIRMNYNIESTYKIACFNICDC